MAKAKKTKPDAAGLPHNAELRSLLEARGFSNGALVEHGEKFFGFTVHAATYGRVVNGWRHPVLEAVIADALKFPFADVGLTEPEEELLAPIWRLLFRAADVRAALAPLSEKERKRL